MNRTDKLWKALRLRGASSMPPAAAVQKRIDQALGENSRLEERRKQMKLSKKAAALALAATTLTGAAWAVNQFNVLDAVFEGDTTIAQPMADNQPRQVSDGNFTLTVASSVSDGRTAYLLVQVEALTDQAKERLFSDEFIHMDTFSVRPIWKNPEEDLYIRGVGMKEEKSQNTENSRVWSMDVDMDVDRVQGVRLRLYDMAKDLAVETPLTPAESVAVPIGAEGPGAPNLENGLGGQIQIEKISLSPFTCRVESAYDAERQSADPLLFFRMKDGSLRTQSQMMEFTSGGVEEEWEYGENWISNYQFKSVQDLSQIQAIVVFGMEYPLDGGQAKPAQIDQKLMPFRIDFDETMVQRLGENNGYAMPIAQVCQGLGAEYRWDQDSQTATCRYRDTEIIFTLGSDIALVNGQKEKLEGAPELRRGQLMISPLYLDDWWGIEIFAAWDEGLNSEKDRDCWIVIP